MDKKYLINIDIVLKSIDVRTSKIGFLVKGNTIFRNEKYIERTNNEFIKWYYGEGQLFSSYESFKNIEPYFEDLFKAYENFFDIYSNNEKSGIFFSAKKKKKKLYDSYIDIKQKAEKLKNAIILFKQNLMDSPLYKKQDNSSLQHETEKFSPDNTDSPEPGEQINKKQPKEGKDIPYDNLNLDDEIKRILS